MSKHQLQQNLQASAQSSQDLFSKVEQELAQGYFEVEVTGMSFRRFVVVYTLLLRSAWTHTVGGVRSLFHVDPAPQA